MMKAADMTFKKYTWVILLLALGFVAWDRLGLDEYFGAPPNAGDQAIAWAYDTRANDFQVSGEGTVVRVLADDNDGSRHQRFVLELASGHSLLVAHNIDLAPRISGLERGDRVAFNGVYEWNDRGGVIHWTHHDPDGRHEAGWLKHDGRTYQ